MTVELHDGLVGGRRHGLTAHWWGERGLSGGAQAGGQRSLLATTVVQSLATAEVRVVSPGQVEVLHLLLDVEVTGRGDGPGAQLPVGAVQHVLGDLQLLAGSSPEDSAQELEGLLLGEFFK